MACGFLLRTARRTGCYILPETALPALTSIVCMYPAFETVAVRDTASKTLEGSWGFRVSLEYRTMLRTCTGRYYVVVPAEGSKSFDWNELMRGNRSRYDHRHCTAVSCRLRESSLSRTTTTETSPIIFVAPQ